MPGLVKVVVKKNFVGVVAQKPWQAIQAANKALELAPDETDMYAVLYNAYTATGDKVKAAEAKKKLPVNASEIFNQAVPLLNAGKFREAEPILKSAVAADPTFAPAQYQLGFVYFQLGDIAAAKQYLATYLKLDPNGADAAVAKEILKMK